MQPVSFKRHRFPPDVIRQAVWLYFRFTLSFRDVEEMLAERGIDVSYETVRCWSLKFGCLFAQNLRRSRPNPTGRWHLDEMAAKIRGKRMWLWRAVDDEGEVLDVLVQKRRNTKAALRLLRKLLKNQASIRRHLRRINSLRMVLRFEHSAAVNGTARDECSLTIEQRILTWSFDDASANSRSSSRSLQPRGFSPPRRPSTTPSTRNAT